MTVVCAGNKSASAKIVEGAGRLLGIMVSTSSSLTLLVRDGIDTNGTVMINTTAAITAPAFFAVQGDFATGIHVTIGGSGNYAIIYEQGSGRQGR